ncbi:uncharacterized protein LOC129718811 [Wyeomyia smithii]|uniref:uncharacterized protein LOC129718811 n=1 Tax=Wyeomyia smithii TaxID=174621 RepID=UPI002467F55C|nr:uncharacterized protein LOC129718811 [Wyeomyia smithii]XP_055525892.1 uncharacterized protein LOC129718811 [Wyeomyia smithii]
MAGSMPSARERQMRRTVPGAACSLRLRVRTEKDTGWQKLPKIEPTVGRSASTRSRCSPAQRTAMPKTTCRDSIELSTESEAGISLCRSCVMTRTATCLLINRRLQPSGRSIFRRYCAIGELKNDKAAEKDGISAELLKAGSERLYYAIHQIILRIWADEQMPNDWLEGLICPIYKKGHRLDCGNYRGITLLNSAYKVLSRILFFRLRPLTESFVGEYQAGFRQGRSTTDQIFTLRQILDKFREYNLTTHHMFVDFRAAYDSVKRNELWQIILEHGFPTKLIKLSRMTLEGSKSCVRIAGETSAAFVTSTPW